MKPHELRNEWAGRRVTVMGLGRHGGGVGVVRWLASLDAIVTVTDLAPAEHLEASLEQLADVPVAAYHLGQHLPGDFLRCEALIVNPAVPLGHPLVRQAIDRDVPVMTEIELLLELCPARMIGVTGTNGKSTTSLLISRMLASGGQRAWLGGNIGGSLLADLPHIEPADWVVVELSSFQLAWLSDMCPLPQVAVVTTCTPNHLDWHRQWADYVAAKQRLLVSRRCSDVAILNSYDSEVAGWRNQTHRKLLEPWPLDRLPPLAHLPGEHNRQNAALAATAALAAGCDESAVAAGCAEVDPLPHRLQTVGRAGGVTYIDDSKSTTAEAANAALRTVPGRVWLLCGGRAKGVPLAPLAAAVAGSATGAAMYGECGADLFEAVRQMEPAFDAALCSTLDEAFAWCVARAAAGDTVLLSPGASSLDQFADFAARGARFQQLVVQRIAAAR